MRDLCRAAFQGCYSEYHLNIAKVSLVTQIAAMFGESSLGYQYKKDAAKAVDTVISIELLRRKSELGLLGMFEQSSLVDTIDNLRNAGFPDY